MELFPPHNAEDVFSLCSLFVEKLPSHRDYQQCAVPEKQDIMKVGGVDAPPGDQMLQEAPLLISFSSSSASSPPSSHPLGSSSTENSFH